MANKEKIFTLKLGASVMPNFTSSFSKASQEVNKLSAEYKKNQAAMERNLSKQKSIEAGLKKEIESEKNLRSEIEKLNLEYRQNLSISADLNTKRIRNKKLAKEDREELARANKEIDSFNKKSSEQKLKLDGVNEKIAAQKDRVRLLNNEYSKLNSQQKKIDDSRVSAERKGKVENRFKAAKNIGNQAGTISQNSFRIGTAILTPLIGSAVAAAKNEYEFAAVRKQFDFKDKSEQENFKAELFKLVTEKNLAISLPELYQAAASMGQSGISKEETPKAIEMSTKMALAFDIDPGQAAQQMMELKNSFGLDWAGIEKLLDQINAMSNNSATDAQTLTDFMKRAGQIGGLAGFSKEQTIGIGTYLLESGVQADRAATALKKLSLGLMKGKGATEKQYAAWKKIGFNPEKLSKDMMRDSQETLNKVMENLKKVRKEELPAIVDALFGEESLDSIVKMLSNMDRVNTNIGVAENEKITKGSNAREAEIFNETTFMKYKRLITELQIASDKVGAALLPTFTNWSKEIKSVSDSISELQKNDPKQFEKTINNIKDLGVALIGLSAASKGVQLLTTLGTLIASISTYWAVGAVATPFAFLKGWKLADKIDMGKIAEANLNPELVDPDNLDGAFERKESTPKVNLYEIYKNLNGVYDREQKDGNNDTETNSKLDLYESYKNLVGVYDREQKEISNNTLTQNINYSPIINVASENGNNLAEVLKDDKARFVEELNFRKNIEKIKAENKRWGQGR